MPVSVCVCRARQNELFAATAFEEEQCVCTHLRAGTARRCFLVASACSFKGRSQNTSSPQDGVFCAQLTQSIGGRVHQLVSANAQPYLTRGLLNKGCAGTGEVSRGDAPPQWQNDPCGFGAPTRLGPSLQEGRTSLRHAVMRKCQRFRGAWRTPVGRPHMYVDVGHTSGPSLSRTLLRVK
jgi:hypothetical protein